MAINTAELRVDSIDVHISYPEVETSYAVPRDADVVTLIGFCGGDSDFSEVIPVRYIEQALEEIGAYDSNKRISHDLGRALLSTWNAGAEYVVIVKAGDIVELANMSDDAKARLMYDRLAEAYDVAIGLEWSGFVVPTDVKFEGHQIHYTGQICSVVDDDNPHLLSFSHADTRFSVKVTALYDDGVLIDPELWVQTPFDSRIALSEAYHSTGSLTCDWYAHIDFAAQLAHACASGVGSISASAAGDGTFVQGVIGSDSNSYQELIQMDSLADKFMWQTLNCKKDAGWIPLVDDYRFVSVVAGSAHYYLERFGIAFSYGLAAAYAGLCSSLPYDVSAAGRVIQNIQMPSRFSKDEMDKLSFLGIITFDEPVEARRWRMSRAVCMTDQSLAVHASDFQQNVTMRLIRRVVFHMKDRLTAVIGSDGSGIADIVTSGMEYFIDMDYIKKYDYQYAMDSYDAHKINLRLMVNPYFSTKFIEVHLKAGPFNG